MESKFLESALYNGMTADAFKLGTVLSLGWFWQRVSGCHIIYRGQDGVFDYDALQAVMNVDGSQVSIVNQALPADTIWHYIRRQASGCGLESADSVPCVIIIDSAGDMVGNSPNQPTNLTIEQLSGAKLKLRWRYSIAGQEIAPTGFNIYIDSGAGFDYDAPTDTLAYGTGGSGEFNWTSSALSNGTRYKFCVRSYRTAAGESQNINFVSALADSAGPAAITNLISNWKEN